MPHLEKILGLTRSNLERAIGRPLTDGFIPAVPLVSLLHHAEFRVRDEVEDDPTFKQIIPYVKFVSHVGNQTFVFAYARGKKGAESRLHSKLSIGVGGHIEESDLSGEISIATYQNAISREIAEEVESIPQPLTPSILGGLINDDSNSVGSVHIGCLHTVNLIDPTLWSKEDDLACPRFLDSRRLQLYRDQFETWSQIVIDKQFPSERT
jgi:predicted NUDIX family phosphoesterase